MQRCMIYHLQDCCLQLMLNTKLLVTDTRFYPAKRQQLQELWDFSNKSIWTFLSKLSFFCMFIHTYCGIHWVLWFKFCSEDCALLAANRIAKIFHNYKGWANHPANSCVIIIASDNSECMDIYVQMNEEKLMHEESILFHFF